MSSISSIFGYILIGVTFICGCTNKNPRILDFRDNSKESGFVEFHLAFENKPKDPFFTKFLIYKYNERGDKLFTESIDSGIRIIEKPGRHTYFVRMKGSVESEKVVVDVVDKMTTLVTINVYFGILESTTKWDLFGPSDIERTKQYYYIEVSISENIPIK